MEGEGVPVPDDSICPVCSQAVTKFVSSASRPQLVDQTKSTVPERIDPSKPEEMLWQLNCGCRLTAAQVGKVASGKSKMNFGVDVARMLVLEQGYQQLNGPTNTTKQLEVSRPMPPIGQPATVKPQQPLRRRLVLD